MEDIFCNVYNWQKIISIIYKELLEIMFKKTNSPVGGGEVIRKRHG